MFSSASFFNICRQQWHLSENWCIIVVFYWWPPTTCHSNLGWYINHLMHYIMCIFWSFFKRYQHKMDPCVVIHALLLSIRLLPLSNTSLLVLYSKVSLTFYIEWSKPKTICPEYTYQTCHVCHWLLSIFYFTLKICIKPTYFAHLPLLSSTHLIWIDFYEKNSFTNELLLYTKLKENY